MTAYTTVSTPVKVWGSRLFEEIERLEDCGESTPWVKGRIRRLFEIEEAVVESALAIVSYSDLKSLVPDFDLSEDWTGADDFAVRCLNSEEVA